MKKITISFAVVLIPIFAGAWEVMPEKAPAPIENPMSVEKIELGKKLYFDPRLSADGTVSCNTCHNVMGSGTDNLPFSKGIKGQLGGRNAPTVWNSAFWSVQFWDGRAATLEDQAKGPMINPVEMGNKDHIAVIQNLKKIPGYVKEFEKVFGGTDSLTIDNTAKAIAAYERTLITPNSAFDRYLKGDKKAMTSDAIKGMDLVKTVGCTACHSGPHFAGPAMPIGQGFYMKFPTFTDNNFEKKYHFSKDLGRYETTQLESDKNMFRVQSWRNISETSPYFHNGSVSTLDEAVRVMAKTQLNKNLKAMEVKEIVAFLKSLKGEFPRQTEPLLP